MSTALWSDKKIVLISFAAAGVTIIAGILHLLMAPRSISHNPGEGVLFLVGGTLQVFWALPVIKRWGKVWQIIGIVGTAVFVILWVSDRLHLIPEGGMAPKNVVGSNMTGGVRPDGDRPRGNMPSGIGGMALPIEICQIAFIGLYVTLIKLNSKRQKKAEA